MFMLQCTNNYVVMHAYDFKHDAVKMVALLEITWHPAYIHTM